MVTKKMLIDATHPEETRVVVLDGKRLENFDIEVESRKQLKGNIYLAKVTRVEPSLQAAFVDYGGNRHGFLSFNEIHPDYYQIPVEDRQALVEEEAVEAKSEDDFPHPENGETEAGEIEILGGDEAEEIGVRRRKPLHRRYKIQEVVKRRQVILIQVVKEERGNKGAALTTYISLAGRYCVLMPNTARGGGISRKINNGGDRKRLKSILADLKIPQGMAVIVRTAGINRSKAEIKRDYEYLCRLWDQIRELTLDSTAPSLVHEEGNLIKRSIRDLYSRDIDEIIVDGNEAYRMAKDFMKLLIPSHAKRVQPYKDTDMPLMHRFQVESQLDAMHSPEVQLKSGGYIVINQTEALVAIDVNSGRATRERNIEETALRTNLEAADEVARQLRLRDLAGLIVIDFIDMDISRNNTKVERQFKDSVRLDRARIQLGRISPFGLLELSRQRLRPSLIETSSEPCHYCGGTGIRRSTDTAALNVLRAIGEEGLHNRSTEITVHVATEIALYILNYKRAALADIETRYGFTVHLTGDDSLIPPAHRIERTGPKAGAVEETSKTTAGEPANDSGEDAPAKRKRRRSRRRKKSGNGDAVASDAVGEQARPGNEDKEPAEEGTDESRAKRRRRGKRGGRRRGRKPTEDRAASEDQPSLLTGPDEAPLLEAPKADGEAIALGNGTKAETETPKEEEKTKPKRKRSPEKSTKPESGEEEKPAPKRRRRGPKKKEEAPESPKGDDAVVSEEEKAARKTTVINLDEARKNTEKDAEPAKPKKGWWSR